MSPTPRRSTILEVAHLAGASKTSVSRYFGEERGRLSPSLQAQIAQAADTLGYQPNLMARGLKGGRSKLIGMLVADIRNPFSVAITHGVEQACRQYGYSLVVCNTDNDPEQERQHLDLLGAYQVEGLVVNASGSPERQLHTFISQGTPIVLLDREVDHVEVEVVGLDNHLAIDMALEHLTEQGYQAVLYVSEAPQQSSPRQKRLSRFSHAAEQHGLNYATSLLATSDSTATLQALSDFLTTQQQHACAVLCGNGNATLTVTRLFQQLSLPLGKVGLMGIDELDWCALVPPGITTLAQPTDAIGKTAVQCLVHRIAPHTSSMPTTLCFAPTLIERGSTQR
ncbi:LacI family DNA-binding transcriptional regulator [Vreelandella boliviensis]|uniref:HTH-type transcriptional regulator kdgR n=1 Tax=Vreelandella boliviensis LC1 TaxID=1072583 RepID=A0A265DXT7_9GAMM|nr:substrate-binding domain-containing protein [Halomonas boliviensis]EHJ91214.1 HTH-type transcriptional regulator kdgR [Halomonas boliviensis LC1]OZT74139.1 LacI family transcriptional regulator [Halomonas boliviensis LC1]